MACLIIQWIEFNEKFNEKNHYLEIYSVVQMHLFDCNLVFICYY